MNNILVKKKIVNIINDNRSFDYQLDVNDFLIINYYNENVSNIKINIVQNNNSSVLLNFLGIVKADVNVDINALLTGDNNKCIIKTRLLSEKEKVNVNVCVKANENTKDNFIIEDLKGLNENGSVILNPVLEIDTKDVDASHFATIGGFDEKQKFYLQSLGLSNDKVYELLKKSFINGLFDNDFLNLLNGGKEKDE